MTSNEDWVVPASRDERRFAVFNIADTHRGDRPYFSAIVQELHDGGHAAMLHDLLSRQLERHPSENVPQTAGLTAQKEISLGAIGTWWLEKLRDGVIGGSDGDWEKGPITVNRIVLQTSLRAVAPRLAPRAAAILLGLELKRMVPGIVGHQRRVEGRPTRMYKIPSLADCRAAYEALAGPTSWDS